MSVLRETRDNLLDAREGAFLSLSVELAPDVPGLGLLVLPRAGPGILRTARWEPRSPGRRATGSASPTGWTSSCWPRRSCSAAPPRPSARAERNTLRGFATNSVGPEGPVPGLSRGGEALLILNQEVRYRHPWGIGVAVFYDVGNVYEEIKDLTSLELRHSIGAGLRYDSPLGLLRVDFGVPLNKRSTDRSFQWFFSLGQAF